SKGKELLHLLVKDFLTATKGIDYSRELFWQAPTKQLIPLAEIIVNSDSILLIADATLQLPALTLLSVHNDLVQISQSLPSCIFTVTISKITN
ncbi:MAG: hypothetical protein Q4B66_02295, partial [Ligilactobacillus agilis]|nr:hypothetical protein [Ligilactobacillus agilis]